MSVLSEAEREWQRTEAAAQRIDVKADRVSPAALRALALDEFLAIEIPPRSYLLDPVVPRQGIVMIHGPRGLGKTHLSLGMAYAIASGGTFLRWTAPEPRGVLYIDGEMPARTLQERIAHLVKANSVEATAPLKIVTPDFNIERGMPNLSEADGQSAVDALIGEDTHVVFVDNLSCLARSGVENDAESWLPLQTWALRHRAAGRSVVFIHHSGKGGAQRGTSRREDVLDTVIGLRKPDDYSAEQGARFEIHFEKARGFYGDTAKPFEAQLGADTSGKQHWTLTELSDDRQSQIEQMCDAGIKPDDIAAELGIDRATVYRRIGKQKGSRRNATARATDIRRG